MLDPVSELAQIAERMKQFGIPDTMTELNESLDKLERAALEIGHSWSRSWFGYQAYVYYEYFKPPGNDAYFDKKRGIQKQRDSSNQTKGNWKEYKQEEVITEIEQRAGSPDITVGLNIRIRAHAVIEQEKQNLLSIIDIELNYSQSQFLSDIKEELQGLTTRTPPAILQDWRPSTTARISDLRALQGGWKTPPHLEILAVVVSIREPMHAALSLSQTALSLQAHISRSRISQPPVQLGTNIFIGHGRSPLWRELKDFIEDQLHLTVEEFNRVQPAGASITDRLMEMLSSANIAFLVMTGEDEQPTGELRPRENIVHEAGLFQGRLGFKRAVVLLEEGCQKFSNNAGLVHINFPKSNIKAAFQDVREVLEREEVLSQGANE